MIHRKSTRLRDEVDYLQSSDKESSLPPSFSKHLEIISKEDVQILRKERDHLLDKFSEMEAENLSGRIHTSKMQDQIDALNTKKYELEEQLKYALSHKFDFNSTSSSIEPNSPDSTKPPPPYILEKTFRKSGASTQLIGGNRSSFTPIVLKSQVPFLIDNLRTTNDAFIDHNTQQENRKQIKNDFNLGRLDGLVSSPNRTSKIRVADSKKIAAILLETNPIELQRHLLTLTVQNQVSFFICLNKINPINVK